MSRLRLLRICSLARCMAELLAFSLESWPGMELPFVDDASMIAQPPSALGNGEGGVGIACRAGGEESALCLCTLRKRCLCSLSTRVNANDT